MATKFLDDNGLLYFWQKIKTLFAPLASPAFTGTPTAPTATSGDSSTQIATTAFVADAVTAGSGEVNQNAFSNVKVGGTTVAADMKTDTVEFIAGTNVSISANASDDSVTFSATDTTYNDATTSTHGLMSTTDKAKLDGLDQLVDSGNGISVTVTADTCIESIIVHGKSVQNGTPTTSSPVEIKSVEDQNLIRLLKSDIKSYNTSGTWSGNVYSYRGITATLNDDGTITIDGTATGNFNFYLLPSDHQIVVPVDSYKITGGISGGSDSSYYLQATSTTNASGTVQARNRDYGSGNVFSTNSSTYGLACYFHASTGNSFDNDTLSPCIMKSDIAVPIHNIGLAINASIIPVNISNEIGSSILDGTCNDFLIDSVGHVTMIKRIQKKIIDESITWSTYSAWDGNGEYCLYNKFNDADKNSIPLCSCLTGYSKSDFSGSAKPVESCAFDDGKNFCVRTPYSTSDNFKTWLASNNQVVFYKLETPEIVDLGYIDIPEISNNSVISINSLVTPSMQVQWWTEYASSISNAIQSLKTLMLQ